MSDVPVADHLELSEGLTSRVLAPMKQTFVGKDEIIDLLGVCLVGGENLFIHGPPGTAKSALVHDLGRRIDGRVFDYLLTRFTEPNELFGPFDIRRLRDGELVTNTEGMLPEASLVFLDELLNANSAILNSLLMALNERVFRRGRETRPLPTLMVVGASNSLPQDDALGALFDRFLLRVRCDNVAQEQLSEVLTAGWRFDREGWNRLDGSDGSLTTSATEASATGDGRRPGVSTEAIRALQRLTWDVDLAPVRAAYVDLVHRLRHAGIAVSDRRAVKLQRLVAAGALLCGRMQADPSDLWVFRFIWDTEEQQEVLAGIVQDAIEPGRGGGGAAPPTCVD
jgi:MoxR-like ATPase